MKSIKTLDSVDQAIISLTNSGNSVKEISREIKLSPSKIYYRIRAMKEYYKCKSLTELCSKVGQKEVRPA